MRAGLTFNSIISLSFFSTSALSFAASSFAAGAASVLFAAGVASPSFAAAGASEYHRIARGAATRVLTSGCLKMCAVRGAACLEARRIVLCSIVVYVNENLWQSGIMRVPKDGERRVELCLCGVER